VAKIARQFFAEAAVLTVAGAACGLLAAELVLALTPQFVAGAGLLEPLRLDCTAFTAALVLAVVVTAVLAAAPTFSFARNLAALIKARGRQSSGGSRSRGAWSAGN